MINDPITKTVYNSLLLQLIRYFMTSELPEWAAKWIGCQPSRFDKLGFAPFTTSCLHHEMSRPIHGIEKYVSYDIVQEKLGKTNTYA